MEAKTGDIKHDGISASDFKSHNWKLKPIADVFTDGIQFSLNPTIGS